MSIEEYTSGDVQLEDAQVEVEKPPLFSVVFLMTISHQWSLLFT